MFPATRGGRYRILSRAYVIFIVVLAIMMVNIMSYDSLSGLGGGFGGIIALGLSAILAIGVIVLLAASLYVTKLVESGRESSKLPFLGLLRLAMAYCVGVTILSTIEILFALGVTLLRNDAYGALIFPDLILSNLLFVLTTLYFGWLHGKKVLILSFGIVLILFFYHRFDMLRSSYCTEISPTQCGIERSVPIKKDKNDSVFMKI